MDTSGKVIAYLIYFPVSVVLTVWVATTLFRHGRRFLLDVFKNDEQLADSVNHLLVVGFYLINLGYVSLQLKLDDAPASAAGVIEALSVKVGLVLVVLGAMHFTNLFVFSKMRREARRPVRPTGAAATEPSPWTAIPPPPPRPGGAQ
jgi:hypothetical protein